MVIRKMNSIFSSHGKYIFAIITLAVIVSFLGFMTPQFLSVFVKNPQTATVGRIFDKDISIEDVNLQARKNMLVMSLLFGSFEINSAYLEMARKMAFPAMCEQAVAEQRNLSVSDEEIAGFIRSRPAFKSADGKFSKEKYKVYVKELKKNNYSVKDLEEAIRGHLLRDKLNSQISENIIVTPAEVKAFYNDYNEKFKVRAARFKVDDFIKGTKLTDVEVKKYFEENRGLYKMPEKFQAVIIKFNYVDAEKDAVKSVSDEDLKNYYEENKASFKTIKGEQKDFATAKKDVMKALVRERCREMTLRKAQIFARDVYEKIAEAKDVKSQLSEFKKFAKENKLELYESEWLDAKSTKVCKRWIEPELVKQITLVYEKIPVSNAVAGSRSAFVAFVKEKQPERAAQFSEVKELVSAQLLHRKAMEKARYEAKKLSLELAPLKGDKLLQTLEKSKVKFEKLDTFMARNPPYGADGSIISSIAEKLSAGHVSMPEETAYGALLVYVESRTLPDPADFKKDELMATNYYKRYKLMAAQSALAEYIRANCQLQR